MNNSIDGFLDHLRHVKGRSDHTQFAYGADVAAFMRFVEERMGRPAAVADFTKLNLRACLATEHERCAPSTVARRIHGWRTFGRYLVRKGLLAENPARALRLPKRESRVPQAPSAEEIARMIDAINPATPRGARDAAVVELLFASGLRAAEACALTVQDVDLENREVFVSGGKGGKDRLALIGRPAAAALRRYLEARPKLVHPRTGRQDAALLLNARGGALTARSLFRIVRAAGELIGRPEMGPHDMRRAFTTCLLDAGADLTAVKDLLGHASVGVTAKYDAASIGRLRRTFAATHPHALDAPATGDETGP